MIILVHTIVALLATGFGLVCVVRLSQHRENNGGDFFAILSALTCITALGVPFSGITPAFSLVIITGVLIAIYTALRKRRAFHGWSMRFASLSLMLIAYAHVLALIIQSFRQIPVLNSLAPTGSEPPIVVAHVISILAFGTLAFMALRTKRKPTSHPAGGTIGSG